MEIFLFAQSLRNFWRKTQWGNFFSIMIQSWSKMKFAENFKRDMYLMFFLKFYVREMDAQQHILQTRLVTWHQSVSL